MTKFDEAFKRNVVQVYLDGGAGADVLSTRFGVSANVILRWVRTYCEHGDAGLCKKFVHYSGAFKSEVLQRVKAQGLSDSAAAILYDLRGGSGVVAKWRRLYDEGGLQALKSRHELAIQTMHTPKRLSRRAQPARLPQERLAGPAADEALAALRKENDYLRTEVAYLKKLDALVRSQAPAQSVPATPVKPVTPSKRKP